MVDKNLLLYLPFDDPDGSKAYDYSSGRHDATLSDGATFSKNAKTGKALELNGGECLTAQAIPFTTDFTVCAYVKVGTNRLGWLLSLAGLDQYREQWLDVAPETWYFVAFVREGSTFKVFLNSECVYVGAISGNPTGFSLSTDELLTTTASLDEVQIFNVAKTEKEILKMQAETDVEYYIDGINFKDYGVYVSASTGIIGRLAQKEALTVDYDNYHGVVRDRKRKRYKERVINLQCFIEASSRTAFVEWVTRFFALFDGDGTHRLSIEVAGKAKPLVYEVDLLDEADMDKKWGSYNNELMVGKFTLKLTEDEPVKKVLRHISANNNSKATITTTTYKLLNIYWGDGTHTFNVGGNDTTVEHTYALPGEYDIVVTGVIEDIEKFETNAIVVWDLLK
ncbi:MAG: LamG domain-containing protein [Lachnospiraceae bacterium]|nr:LamG domain-containing protein [Lachnospiraceae bacterium]